LREFCFSEHAFSRSGQQISLVEVPFYASDPLFCTSEVQISPSEMPFCTLRRGFCPLEEPRNGGMMRNRR
jgi:hypothetical protein